MTVNACDRPALYIVKRSLVRLHDARSLSVTCSCTLLWLSLQKLQKEGMERVSPVQLASLANAHGMTLLLQRTKNLDPQLRMSFAERSRVEVFWFPSGTFYPMARGLSPQHLGSKLPVCWLCGHASPALQAANSA
ncbi:unnamed protein product [Durusdinium trenchii]|uniref:Uncharacterized protein n=2 Tax=Durusdinium trenchii TaxID=1381693 RepID=A0ABP0RGS8_9DINO